MQRVTLQRFLGLVVLPAALVALLAAPATAAAPVIQLGGPNGLARPSCDGTAANDRGAPKGLGRCSVLTLTTIYPIRDGSTTNPTTVPKAARIVAVTLRVGKLADSKKCLKYTIKRVKVGKVYKRKRVCTKYDAFAEKTYFDKTFGSGSKVRIVVLRPVKKPRHSKAVLLKKVVSVGPVFRLEPWFGKTVTLPLAQTIPVAKGDVVGLSVPTYAPILPLSASGSRDAWRASRPPAGFKPKDPKTGLPITVDPVTHKKVDPCSTKYGVIFAQSALQTPKFTADFRCSYPGVPTFQFTLIPSP